MTLSLANILNKLDEEALASLSKEEKAFLKKQTMKPEDLLNEDTPRDQALLVILRITSLLLATPLEEENNWSDELQALSLFEDKELVNMLKRAAKLPCFKTRNKPKTQVDVPPTEDNPLI